MTEKKPKKKPKYNARTALTSAIRKVWRASDTYRDFIKLSRVAPNTWICASCGARVLGRVTNKETGKSYCEYRVDHIDPVVAPALGFTGWESYIQNMMFCGTSNLQILCIPCHKTKWTEEQNARKKAKGR